jgi:hypothetical protein
MQLSDGDYSITGWQSCRDCKLLCYNTRVYDLMETLSANCSLMAGRIVLRALYFE